MLSYLKLPTPEITFYSQQKWNLSIDNLYFKYSGKKTKKEYFLYFGKKIFLEVITIELSFGEIRSFLAHLGILRE